jgi:hypothetical protein
MITAEELESLESLESFEEETIFSWSDEDVSTETYSERQDRELHEELAKDREEDQKLTEAYLVHLTKKLCKTSVRIFPLRLSIDEMDSEYEKFLHQEAAEKEKQIVEICTWYEAYERTKISPTMSHEEQWNQYICELKQHFAEKKERQRLENKKKGETNRLFRQEKTNKLHEKRKRKRKSLKTPTEQRQQDFRNPYIKERKFPIDCRFGFRCRYVRQNGPPGVFENYGPRLCKFWHPAETMESYFARCKN